MMNAEDKYKVVIVDDERTAIDALRRELGAYQEFEIKGTANNGAKGKKMIMELRPDLLFLDVELPDVLGLNLLSEMRDEVLWDMKVVFYTSYDKYLLQALRESAFDFLLKPFETGDLRVVIERYRKACSFNTGNSFFLFFFFCQCFDAATGNVYDQHGDGIQAFATGRNRLFRISERQAAVAGSPVQSDPIESEAKYKSRRYHWLFTSFYPDQPVGYCQC